MGKRNSMQGIHFAYESSVKRKNASSTACVFLGRPCINLWRGQKVLLKRPRRCDFSLSPKTHLSFQSSTNRCDKSPESMTKCEHNFCAIFTLPNSQRGKSVTPILSQKGVKTNGDHFGRLRGQSLNSRWRFPHVTTSAAAWTRKMSIVGEGGEEFFSLGRGNKGAALLCTRHFWTDLPDRAWKKIQKKNIFRQQNPRGFFSCWQNDLWNFSLLLHLGHESFDALDVFSLRFVV